MPGETQFTVTPSFATTRESDLDQMLVANRRIQAEWLFATRDIDNPAELLFLHPFDKSVSQVTAGVEIEAHTFFPLVGCSEPALDRSRAAGVIDQDIEVPECIEHCVSNPARSVAISDILRQN